MKRRQFITKTTQVFSGVYIFSSLGSFSTHQTKSPVIHKIELFLYGINIPRHFSWGTWFNRQQVFMKLSAGDFYGWAEVSASKNNPDIDLADWGGFLKEYKGLTINDAYTLLKSKQVSEPDLQKSKIEFVEMALLDILGKIEEKPAVELLCMNAKKPIPGMFCILNKEPDKIEEYISSAKKQNLQHFMKVKLFGDENTDLPIIKQVRELLGDSPFVLSDANRGYKNWQSMEDLAKPLMVLRDNGLNAMEDPAEMTNEQWKELQLKVGSLSLVPDYPMRPAWEGVERAEKGMGRFYNLHPESMGSLHHLTACAEKVKSFGASLMIGDASFVGPACTVWQQIGIGLGASWVESLEKIDESADYLNCVKSIATFRNEKGNFTFDPKPGFGLEINEQSLKNLSSSNRNYCLF